MALDSASFPELWTIFQKTGDIRPEYLLPVLWGESSFSPSAENADHYGLNQADGGVPQGQPGGPSGLRGRGIDPTDYKTWPASRQLHTVVSPFLLGLIHSFGPIRSGTRLYQANFVPASLPIATSFEDVVVGKGGRRYGGQEGSFYDSNLILDIGTSSDPVGRDGLHHKGSITVGDLAARVAAMAAVPQVAHAIDLAYKMKPPGVTAPVVIHDPGATVVVQVPVDRPHNPVDGEDYTAQGQYVGGGSIVPSPKSPPATSSVWPLVLAGGAIAAAGIGAWWYLEHHGKRRNPIAEESQVQSLLFKRDAGWTVARARSWASQHGYRSSKVDVTDDYVRLRQAPPGRFARMRTKSFGQGIRAVVGFGS